MSRFPRRAFLQSTAGLAASDVFLPDWLGDLSYGMKLAYQEGSSDRRRLGSIGVGGQGTGIMYSARRFADQIAVCDVDKSHAERGARLGRRRRRGEAQGEEPADDGRRAEIYSDYRKLLERNDIDVVTIGTPDHWHTRICIEALRAGKDVYCEKPLTLTVAEGQQLVKVVQETGRVLQVGTQQRSQVDLFGRAIATIRAGQLGKLKKITVSLPLSTDEGGPFEKQPVPEGLDWDFWLGQAPLADYCPQRCHFQFRWWYEYSGGIATDWGAHHMDIAQWGMNLSESGPTTIDSTATKMPNIPGGYNTPKQMRCTYMYPGDVEVFMTTETGDEGVLFEGENGRMYVNRGRITGKPIEEQDNDQALRDKVQKILAEEVYRGRKVGDHMADFFNAVADRSKPMSDVVSQHRSVSACHLANISARLQRKLTWDAAKEQFVGDDEANGMLSRAQRSPYEIPA